jgi:endonuclease YncB( thermonuclease family)
MKSKEEENKKLAYKARNRMVEMITNKMVSDKDKRKEIRNILNKETYLVKIKCGDFDKYGRLLAWIFPFESLDKNSDVKESFNHILVKEKLAYFYSGDTKLTEKQQIQLLYKNE